MIFISYTMHVNACAYLYSSSCEREESSENLLPMVRRILLLQLVCAVACGLRVGSVTGLHAARSARAVSMQLVPSVSGQRMLVLGGGGFAGREVCKNAVAQGYKVTSLTRRGENPEPDCELLRQVQWRSGDALDPKTVKARALLEMLLHQDKHAPSQPLRSALASETGRRCRCRVPCHWHPVRRGHGLPQESVAHCVGLQFAAGPRVNLRQHDAQDCIHRDTGARVGACDERLAG